MPDLPKPKTANIHESTWDSHGSYKWTYFNDEVKQRINFFLTQRLYGKNIDIGGGWYLHYPNSTVVDLSSVCLANNPANDKLQFDLDELGNGKHLPYDNSLFDSATLISVWQYLRHQEAVTCELERILKPGAEIYLINGQGGALEKCAVSSGRAEDVQRFFQERGYDTLVENIPSFARNIDEFKSVCVAMPERDLFETSSLIRNKEKRITVNNEICQDPSIFENSFVAWELEKRTNLLSKLSRFPVTKYSREYLNKVEKFSQEYNKQTGGIPLIFIDHGIEPELSMLTSENNSFFGTSFLMGKDEPVDMQKDPSEKLFKKYGLSFINHLNYFYFKTIKSLLEHCATFELEKEPYYGRGNETKLRTFASFISSIALNSFTKELQKQVYDSLNPNVEDLDKRIEREIAFRYSMATFEAKQQRRINKLIQTKEKIKKTGIETIGEGELNFGPYINLMEEVITR